MPDTLTLRDRLAAAALASLAGKPGCAAEDIAAQAYGMADAMLAARQPVPSDELTGARATCGADFPDRLAEWLIRDSRNHAPDFDAVLVTFAKGVTIDCSAMAAWIAGNAR